MAQTKNHRNPATRLIEVLRDFNGNNQSAVEAWALTFEVDAKDPDFGRRLWGLSEAVDDIENTIAALVNEEELDLYLSWTSNIRLAINPGSMNYESKIVSDWLSNCIPSLRFCAIEIDRQLPIAKGMDDKQIDELIESIRVLREQISAAGFEPVFDFSIIRHLDLIDRALREYWISGIEGVEAGLETAIGFLYLNREKIKANAQTDLQKETLDALMQFIGNYQKVVGAASGTMKFLAQLGNLLV